MKDPITSSAIVHLPLPKLPASLEPYFTLLSEPVTLPICRACQAALLPKSLMDHLRKHHQLPVSLRREVRSFVATLPSLEFDDVLSNPDGSAPVGALRVLDAFQCKHCAFIRRDVTDVRKHVNQEHGMSAAGCYGKISAQSWFGGRRAVYWRVCEGVSGTVESEKGREKGSKSEANVVTEQSVIGYDGPPCYWAFTARIKANKLAAEGRG